MTCKHIWKEVLEGPCLDGSHLHVYECKTCGILNKGIERAEDQKVLNSLNKGKNKRRR